MADRADRATVFVTGGSGFLGRNLIPALLGQGLRVRALTRSDAALAVVVRLGAEPVRGNLGDVAARRAGLARCDGAFHLAARTNDWGRYADAYCANVVGTEHVLAAGRGRGGEIYFVTDGAPVEYRAAAGAAESAWRLLRLRRELPLTHFRVRIIGEEVTVSDAKARRELGYAERMSREEGLARMEIGSTSGG